MNIAILSDTHLSSERESLPKNLLRHFRGVDLILHAGDLTVPSVLEDLRVIAPVEAVAGNMDDARVKKMLPRKRVIMAEKMRIGLIHGWGAPTGLPERVLAEFNENVGVVVFGHSHHPYQQQVGDTLLFNPGSAGRGLLTLFRSSGILRVVGDRATAEIVRW